MSPSRGRPAPLGLASDRLIRNSVINLGGHVVPILAGLVSIPLLIRELGTSRFGVLTLAWLAVGYLSLFDLGLGRALTKLVAEQVGTEREAEVPALVWTALGLMLVFGVLGSLLGIALTPWLTQDVLRIPVELQTESKHAFWLLAVSLPVVITSVGLRGLLEAMHLFGWVNAIRIPSGVFTFAGPLLVLPYSNSLAAVVGILVAGRVTAWLAHLVLCARAMPSLFRTVRFDPTTIPLLLGFGGWMTVSNIVGPLMVYLDRFLIAAVISAAAVAYYATPYEVITKIWLIPGALLGVLFPAFSAGLRHDSEWVRQTFKGAADTLLLIVFPVALLSVLFAEEGLTVWLGADFASQSATVAKWLAVGVFVNSLGLVPFTLIQGGGRPDLTAKLHLAEFPPYILCLWWFTTRYGIEGAAAMWTARAGLDALVLFALVPQVLPTASGTARSTVGLTAIGVLALSLAVLPTSIWVKVGYSALMLVATAIVGWARLGGRRE